jgi:hypothetical protein
MIAVLMTNPSSWIEIACDESGFSGTNLLDPASPVITHAGVDLSTVAAAEVVAVLRSRFRHRSEYKSSQLLRSEQLEWFLTTLRGRAHVEVINKAEYVAARVLELFAGHPSYADGTILGRDHTITVRRLRHRTEFLAAFVELTRTKRLKLIDHAAIDHFFTTMPADIPELRMITRAQVEDLMLRLIDDDPTIPPPLEPMIPALANTVLFWSAGERSVAVIHDEQSALTRHRVARLAAYLAETSTPPPLLGVTQVDSKIDPRVQVADLLAGITRRKPPELAGLLDPYLTTRTG